MLCFALLSEEKKTQRIYLNGIIMDHLFRREGRSGGGGGGEDGDEQPDARHQGGLHPAQATRRRIQG